MKSGQPATGGLKSPSSISPAYLSRPVTTVPCTDGVATVTTRGATVSLGSSCRTVKVSADSVVVHAGNLSRVQVSGNNVTVSAGRVGSVGITGSAVAVLYTGDAPTVTDHGRGNVVAPASGLN